MRRRILSYIMIVMLVVVSSVPIHAVEVEEHEIPILTIEEAIQNAKDASRTLSTNERNSKLQSEVLDLQILLGNYAGYKEAKTGQAYLKRIEEVLNETIEFMMMQMFDTIFRLEEEIVLLEQEIELKQRELQNYKVMYENGLMTQLQLQGLEIQLKQLQDRHVQLEIELQNQYTELNVTMGKSKQNVYILEKEKVEYEPYGYDGDVETLAKRKANQHYQLWFAKEDAENVKYNRPSSSKVEYVAHQNEVAEKEQTVKETKENIEASVRSIYTQILQLEAQYELLTANIELQEEQLRMSAVYLENGLMTQFEYDQAVYNYEKSLWELQGLVNGHSYLKKQLDTPDMIPVD